MKLLKIEKILPLKKNAKITVHKILKKYKSIKRPKKTYLNEEDIETIDYNEPQEDLFEEESILKAAGKVLDFDTFKKQQERALIENNLKKKSSKNIAKIAAKKISNKYKNLKKPKKTFLVDEKDLETIVYDEPEEDLFKGESILAAANKVIDFDEFKKQQANAMEKFNENLLENAETINYVDDINLDDVRDKKDLIITCKKISDKYRKFRKRKAADREKQIKEILDSFKLQTKKGKRQTDKLANQAAKNISKKYKNIKFRY